MGRCKLCTNDGGGVFRKYSIINGLKNTIMKSKNNILFLITISIGLVYLASCTKMNDLHDRYLQEGERIYVGQPDSVQVFSGNRRVLLRYWTSDPKASKMIVYWDSRQDSLLVDIPQKSRQEPVDIWVDNLTEKNYSFELITMNSQLTNRSIPFEVNTRVYGENFQESLVNRRLQSALKASASEPLIINWFGEVEQSVNIHIHYLNTNDDTVDTLVSASEIQTVLHDYKEQLTYRTLFKPEISAVDTFYTDFVNVTSRVEIAVPKNTFVRWNPVGIPYSDIGNDYRIEKIWDGSYTFSPVSFYVFAIPGSTLPYSFTFDMGVTKKLSRFKHWQRTNGSVAYTIQNARKFELWGSDSPDVGASFDGWTKLGAYEIVKPVDATTEAKKEEYAMLGDEFDIDPEAPPVRYIRYVIRETWNPNPTHGAVGEITFYSFQD